MSGQKIGVCFVCLGNICRSPLAESMFRAHVNEAGLADRFDICSRGTGGWHIGEGANRDSARVAAKHGVDLSDHRAAQLSGDDIRRYPHMVVMDRSNADNSRAIAQRAGLDIEPVLLLSFDDSTDLQEVPDPYYGGPETFEQVHHLVVSATAALLASLRQQYGL